MEHVWIGSVLRLPEALTCGDPRVVGRAGRRRQVCAPDGRRRAHFINVLAPRMPRRSGPSYSRSGRAIWSFPYSHRKTPVRQTIANLSGTASDAHRILVPSPSSSFHRSDELGAKYCRGDWRAIRWRRSGKSAPGYLMSELSGIVLQSTWNCVDPMPTSCWRCGRRSRASIRARGERDPEALTARERLAGDEPQCRAERNFGHVRRGAATHLSRYGGTQIRRVWTPKRRPEYPSGGDGPNTGFFTEPTPSRGHHSAPERTLLAQLCNHPDVMPRWRFEFLAAIASVALVAGCSDTSISQPNAPSASRCQTALTGVPESIPRFGQSPERLGRDDSGIPWTATAEASWIQLSPNSGQGEASSPSRSRRTPSPLAGPPRSS